MRLGCWCGKEKRKRATPGEWPCVFSTDECLPVARNAEGGTRARTPLWAKLPEGIRGHDLRHRRVTTWLADGKEVVLVKEAVGHADLRTTMGYTHLARDPLRSQLDELQDRRERLNELVT